MSLGLGLQVFLRVVILLLGVEFVLVAQTNNRLCSTPRAGGFERWKGTQERRPCVNACTKEHVRCWLFRFFELLPCACKRERWTLIDADEINVRSHHVKRFFEYTLLCLLPVVLAPHEGVAVQAPGFVCLVDPDHDI